MPNWSILPQRQGENGAIQFEIKADVKLKNNSFIRAGYSANADIVLDRKDSVMVISESLIKFEKEGDSAYVEIETQPQVFEKRYIKTGLSDGVNIEVKEGVGMSDKIKARSRKKLRRPLKKTPELIIYMLSYWLGS